MRIGHAETGTNKLCTLAFRHRFSKTACVESAATPLLRSGSDSPFR
jgi:hypothetical protein